MKTSFPRHTVIVAEKKIMKNKQRSPALIPIWSRLYAANAYHRYVRWQRAEFQTLLGLVYKHGTAACDPTTSGNSVFASQLSLLMSPGLKTINATRTTKLEI